MEVAAADSDSSYAYQDLSWAGFRIGLFGQTQVAWGNQFGYKHGGFLEPL